MKPTKEQERWFWEQRGFRTRPSNEFVATRSAREIRERRQVLLDKLPSVDLNNLFKYAPDIIIGIYFRYYPGGCECELTYITEAGFDTEKSWVKNESGDEKKSRELSALALYWAIYKAFGGKE